MKSKVKSKTTAKITAFLLMAVMLLTLASCGNDKTGDNNAPAVDLSKDREGNAITLPGKIDRIISMGASNTEILAALGFGDKIIATDTYSTNIAGISSDIPMFDMYTPDAEQMLDLQPDVMFVTGMTKSDGIDKFNILNDAGICVIYIPSSSSIEGIKEDIRYLAAAVGAEAKGNSIISDMEKEIADIKKIGGTITDKKTVYFEIDAAPYMYSFGNGVFLNEMIELIGAVNILADQDSWISVTDEAVLGANPDVILTSVKYNDDPAGEIKSRPGWDAATAVKNNDVYYIDADASSRPSQNIVKALKEMAKFVYPDKY
jgi:iron complex transport system substrate-binding protein